MKTSSQIAKEIEALKLKFEVAKKRERAERTVGRVKRLEAMAKKAGVFDLPDEDFRSIETLFAELVAKKGTSGKQAGESGGYAE